MKKIISIVGVLFICISLVACSNDKVASVQPDKVLKMIEDKKSFVLIAASTTCSACTTYKPNYEAFAKDNKDIEVVKVDIDKIKDETIKTEFINTYVVLATPTTYIFEKGELKVSKEGVMPTDKLAGLVSANVKK